MTMSSLTRVDFAEALKVPSIMGRGNAYGVVIGSRRFTGLMTWVCDKDQTLVDDASGRSFGSGAGDIGPCGMRMIITNKYPDTFFAVTESEYADVYKRLGLERGHWVLLPDGPVTAPSQMEMGLSFYRSVVTAACLDFIPSRLRMVDTGSELSVFLPVTVREISDHMCISFMDREDGVDPVVLRLCDVEVLEWVPVSGASL